MYWRWAQKLGIILFDTWNVIGKRGDWKENRRINKKNSDYTTFCYWCQYWIATSFLRITLKYNAKLTDVSKKDHLWYWNCKYKHSFNTSITTESWKSALETAPCLTKVQTSLKTRQKMVKGHFLLFYTFTAERLFELDPQPTLERILLGPFENCSRRQLRPRKISWQFPERCRMSML